MPTDAAIESSNETGHEFRLVVWTSPSAGWRARVTGRDAVEHEFRSPFELARFVAWPADPGAAPRPPAGLR